MKLSVVKEDFAGESRVSATPSSIKKIIKLGYTVSVEKGAGVKADFSDRQYRDAGAEIANDYASVITDADIILCVRIPSAEKQQQLTANQTLIGFLNPAQNLDNLQKLADNQVNAIAVEAVPRISKAQKMDALSSMANIAGYRAVIEASFNFSRFLAGQITAAGKINPAKVLVIGAGVAGLSAIGTATAMGAIVKAFDTRPEVKEQVESLNAEFLMLDFKEDGGTSGGYAKVMSKEFIEAEMQLFAEQAEAVDIIITTALIPGKQAPELITEAMVRTMKPGSVIVDLAAEMGGNCRLSEADKVVEKHNVKIIGYTNLPSRLATQASDLYANNLWHLLTDLTKKDASATTDKLNIDLTDDIFSRATVSGEGKLRWPPEPVPVSAQPKPAQQEQSKPEQSKSEIKQVKPSLFKSLLLFSVLGILVLALGLVAPESLTKHLTVFVLSCFVGYMVIWNVTPSLHTPLMSITNAISSVIIIGALLQISSSLELVKYLSAFVVLITTINIVGGFAVTKRMLAMFSK